MNLYKQYQMPNNLNNYLDAMKVLPEVFWHKLYKNSLELKKREKYIAQSAEHAYLYARYVLKEQFLLAEKHIAKNAEYSYWYARNVLKGPFPAGEEAIALSIEYSYNYMNRVIINKYYVGHPKLMKQFAHLKRFNIEHFTL